MTVCLSYELGYERIIIMEDDIKFLKDKEELNNLLKYIFNNAPENFDIIVGNMELLTDYYYNFSDDFLENKYFRHNNIDADTVYYSCSTINIYSRSGMKKLIDFFEHTYCAIDRYNLFMLNIPDIKLYSIYPWIGVQERYGIEFKNFPQIKNLYNLNNITDNDIYEYFGNHLMHVSIFLNFLFRFFQMSILLILYFLLKILLNPDLFHISLIFHLLYNQILVHIQMFRQLVFL